MYMQIFMGKDTILQSFIITKNCKHMSSISVLNRWWCIIIMGYLAHIKNYILNEYLRIWRKMYVCTHPHADTYSRCDSLAASNNKMNLKRLKPLWQRWHCCDLGNKWPVINGAPSAFSPWQENCILNYTS